MGLFARNNYEVFTDTPGRLTYREGNQEYVFPVYENDGEMVIVGNPSHRRIYLFFGWYWEPREVPADLGARILPRLLDHFRRSGRRARLFDRGDEDGQPFVFYPELFELRSRASEILNQAGFAWFNHYSSIDLLHQEYGLEVCGIHEQSSLKPIAAAMQSSFPQWHYFGVCHNDYGREPGWKFSIHMFPRRCGGDKCVEGE
jgi:hypothetical protein